MVLFDEIACSVAVVVNGHTRLVPSQDDYTKHLRQIGLLDPNVALAGRPDLAETVYRHWQRQPQIACAFAQIIAENPAAHGIRTKVVGDNVNLADVTCTAESVSTFVEEVIADPGIKGATVLIPGLLDVAVLVAFCCALATQQRWKLRAELNPSDRQSRVYVELKREVGVNEEGKIVLAEVLGFGPFNFLPLTRRAPVTALELRTKPDNAGAPKNAFKQPRAHLADLRIDMDFPTVRRVWARTEDARIEVLGGDDSAARARITFAIPQEHWRMSATGMS